MLIIVALSVITAAKAQEWKTKDVEADELKGIESQQVNYVDTDDYLVVVSEKDISVLSKKSVFDFGGMDNHVVVTVGLYDTIQSLVENLKFFGFVNPKQPDLVVLKDYRMRMLNAKHPDNFMVTKIREYLLKADGGVRFIIPLYHYPELDISLPTIK